MKTKSNINQNEVKETSTVIEFQSALGIKASIIINLLSRLSAYQKTILFSISLDALSDLTGLTKREVRTSLTQLTEQNYISRSQNGIKILKPVTFNTKLSDKQSFHYTINDSKEYGIKAAILLSYVQRRIKSALLNNIQSAFFYNWVWTFNTFDELSDLTFLSKKEIQNALKILTQSKAIINRRSGAHGRTHITLPDLTILTQSDNDAENKSILSAIAQKKLIRCPDFNEQKEEAIKAQINKEPEQSERQQALEEIKNELFKKRVNEPIVKKEKREVAVMRETPKTEIQQPVNLASKAKSERINIDEFCNELDSFDFAPKAAEKPKEQPMTAKAIQERFGFVPKRRQSGWTEKEREEELQIRSRNKSFLMNVWDEQERAAI